MNTFVLLRHGSSEWNLSGRFTGWTDILLDEKGLLQAEIAGRMLFQKGFRFDEVHDSVLRRAHQTVERLLVGACHPELARYSTWRLNERHYGKLQGMEKQQIFSIWGEERARKWWRGYYDAPPPLETNDPRHPRFDPLYAGVDPVLLPASESLSDCQARLLPYWFEKLEPGIAEGRCILVVSHGNAIRSLVMHLENIDPISIEKVEITPGMPLVYRFDGSLNLVSREWLE